MVNIQNMKKKLFIISILAALVVVGLFWQNVKATETGPNSPGTMADDATVGTVAWLQPDEAKVSDNIYAQSQAILESSGGDGIIDNVISLVKGGVVFGDNKARANTSIWPTSDTYISYGSSSDSWGVSLSGSDINDTTFGVVISAKGKTKGDISHYLKVTNFGFSIPTNATVDGIDIGVEMKELITPNIYALVDHVRITVYYTEAEENTGKFQIRSGNLEIKSGNLEIK